MSDARPSILLCGATGRTGNAVANELATREDVVLSACIAPSVASGTPTRALPVGIPAFADLASALFATSAAPARVVVDLTHAEPAFTHLEQSLDARVPFVMGATGVAQERLEAFGTRFAEHELGLFVIPNFSIGAVLAIQLAEQLAAYFPDVEIVETHHDGKRDAPSGTALHTAHRVAAARDRSGLSPGAGGGSAGADGGRGESIDGIAVHAIRLPGATAHQEVVFGAPGELVTIRHDAIDRSCYAAGVVRAAHHVRLHVRGLETGLEHAL